MANQQHLDLIMQGVNTWNQWKKVHPRTQPDLNHAVLPEADLSGADLSRAHLNGAILSSARLNGAVLSKANLTGALLGEADLSFADLTEAYLTQANLSFTNLTGANLHGAFLSEADLREANLSGADLREANLSGANFTAAVLRKASLSGADLSFAYLNEADFGEADLSAANLSKSIIVKTNLKQANLTGCSIYGISVWDVELEGAKQSHLIITEKSEPTITVDNLRVAQFIYLLLNNQEIRDVINTIGQKGVLILGRFSEERKPVLDALREKLRTMNFLPIVFDFERPTERDFTETVMTLAGLSCFIIADITNPKSAPLELQATVPNYMVPFVPIIQKGEQPFSMFRDLQGKYNWVLKPLAYDTPSNLIKALEKAILKPALEKRAELLTKKMEQLQMRDIEDYL